MSNTIWIKKVLFAFNNYAKCLDKYQSTDLNEFSPTNLIDVYSKFSRDNNLNRMSVNDEYKIDQDPMTYKSPSKHLLVY